MVSAGDEELQAIARAALGFTASGEELAAVMAAEPTGGLHFYLCAFRCGEALSWLVLDGNGVPVEDAGVVRETASLVAACELAEESAGGGDIGMLLDRLAELRQTENPEGIEEAEDAARALATVIENGPRVARADYLDAIGQASLSLEQALGEIGSSPFAAAMHVGMGVVDELVQDIERGYKRALRG